MTPKELNDILIECLLDEKLSFEENFDFEIQDNETSDDYLNVAEMVIEDCGDLVKVIRYIAIALFLQRQE